MEEGLSSRAGAQSLLSVADGGVRPSAVSTSPFASSLGGLHFKL